MAHVGKLPHSEIPKLNSEASPEVSPSVVMDTTIVVASLLEVLVILGGLMWAVAAPNSGAMFTRILLVVGAAVISGAAFAISVARRPRK